MTSDYKNLHRIARRTLTARLMTEAHHVDEAAFRLLAKFHTETECGEETGDHWSKCDGLVAALGYESWDHWQAIREASITSSSARLEDYLNDQKGQP